MFCYNPFNKGGDSIRGRCGSAPWTPNFILFGEKDNAGQIIHLYGYRYSVPATSNTWYSTNWFLHESVMEDHLMRRNKEDVNISGNLSMSPKSCCSFLF